MDKDESDKTFTGTQGDSSPKPTKQPTKPVSVPAKKSTPFLDLTSDDDEDKDDLFSNTRPKKKAKTDESSKGEESSSAVDSQFSVKKWGSRKTSY